MRIGRKVLLWIVALAVVCGPSVAVRAQGPEGGVDPEITAWLQAHAIPFDTAEPGGGHDDLMPLEEIVGEARIVALGEATHGTHEFFTMKHRLVEFLVEEMGFTVFAMEVSWPEAERINDYIQTGEGDPAQLLIDQGYWVWNTQEVLDLIEWMRAYNVEHPDAPVRFAGFDLSSIPLLRANVIAALEPVDPDAAALAEERYACLPETQEEANIYLQQSRSALTACAGQLQAVYDDLVLFRAGYEPKLGAEAYAVALHTARVLVQSHDVYVLASNTSARDRYMTENLEWLMAQAAPDAKFILWAHNGHLARSRNGYGRNLGSRLEENHGDEMVVIGFLFYQGSANAAAVSVVNEQMQLGPVTPFDVPPAQDGSYEAAFHSTGLPHFILNFRGLELTGDANWLRSLRPMRRFGAGYNPDFADQYFGNATLPISFDAVIFFDDTTPSRLFKMPWQQYAE